VSASITATVVLIVVFAGAILGMLLRPRVPDHHLRDESKEVIRMGMGLVATMAALILGLLVTSAKSTFDSQKDALDQVSAKLMVLDGMLEQYGTGARDARAALRMIVEKAISQAWPASDSQAPTLASADTRTRGMALYRKLQELTPRDDNQRQLQSQALQIAADLGQVRWLLVAHQESNRIPAAFLVILVFWLAVLFCSFGLFASPNVTTVATLALAALSVSGAIFLVLELADPFVGWIQIPSTPLRYVLASLQS
jgi:hypothetical protein